jgi:hypothetical protein
MAVTLVLLKERNYKIRHLDGLRWHDIHAKFHEISIDVEGILRFSFSNLKYCNVGITNGRDLCSAPLKWAQVA